MVSIWNLYRNIKYRERFKEISIQMIGCYSPVNIPYLEIEDFFTLINLDSVKTKSSDQKLLNFIENLNEKAKKNLQFSYYILMYPCLTLQPDLNLPANQNLKGQDIIGALNFLEIASEICDILSCFWNQPFIFLDDLHFQENIEDQNPIKIIAKKEFAIKVSEVDGIDMENSAKNLLANLLCLMKMDEKDYKTLIKSLRQFKASLVLRNFDKSISYALLVSAIDVLAQEYMINRYATKNFINFVLKFDVYDKRFKDEFAKLLDDIYYARSVNFHNGVQFSLGKGRYVHINRYNLRKYIRQSKNPDYKKLIEKEIILNNKKISFKVVRRILNYKNFAEIYRTIILKLLEILPNMPFPCIKKDFDRSFPNEIIMTLKVGGIRPFEVHNIDTLYWRDEDYFDKLS